MACALAPNMPSLIAARALQGIGGGGDLPIAYTVIGDMVSPRERPRYQANTSIMFLAAGVLGPVLGGVLAEHSALVDDLLDQPAARPGRVPG